MVVEELKARPHPSGNRIDLTWSPPDPILFPGMRVVRKAHTHPVHPGDGTLVAEGEGLRQATDSGLQGESIYYYSFFPYSGPTPAYHIDARNRLSCLATAPHGLAQCLYGLLPRIYHRYDIDLPSPAEVAEADKDKGQLKRFLELPGGQLDMLLSQIRALGHIHDSDRTDGALLPLLAHWIGWRTDYQTEVSAQRAELRHATHLYRTVGIIPTVEATVKRIAGWKSRTKEFVDNVFAATRPMRLNLWRAKRVAGSWSSEAAPLSLDYLYQGRAASARDDQGRQWLFYHTERNGRWNIWCKSLAAAPGSEWEESRPLLVRPGMDKHPAAAFQSGRLWVFWESRAGSGWRLESRFHDGVTWSLPEVFGLPAADRRWPCLAADNGGGLWLFWAERMANRWRLRYKARQGGVWQAADQAFPDAAGSDPRVEGEPFVLFHPSGELWVFWARREYGAAGADQGRWRVQWRVKHNLAADASGWDAGLSGLSALDALPNPDYHDREPAAYVDAGGQVRLFWSSNRGGSWGIWTLNLSAPGAPERVTAGPYAARDALPLTLPDGVSVLYRANAPVTYASDVYTATQTRDSRYSGSSTSDTRDAAKTALRGRYDDFGAYTYDAGGPAGRDNEDRYARDTVGLYLATDTLDPSTLEAKRQRLAGVLREFLPGTDRAVFIDEEAVATEAVYAYAPEAGGNGGLGTFIAETWSDHLEAPLDEAPLAGGDDFSDVLE